jgi:putative membrane-bound dehydrogenase-like protein
MLNTLIRGGCGAALLLSLAATALGDTETGYQTIFDGKTLEGWDGNPQFWRVEENAITGETTEENPTEGNTFLIWRGGKTADFELKLEYRLRNHNSGIQYRSFEVPDCQWVVGGYQADMESGDTYSGILYGERFRGILAPRGKLTVIGDDHKPKVFCEIGDSAELQDRIKKGDWNEYHIIARGNHFIHKINGVVMSVCTDEDTEKRRSDGVLALQLHAGPPMKVQFRNIRIKHFEAERPEAEDDDADGKQQSNVNSPDNRPPEAALAGLDVADGLEATLFAAEPMMLSPTNIDVDHRGRVWVCEVVNYRHRKGMRPEGDRILIIEDTNHDGVADKKTVFYQGNDVDTAMGICVLGNKVIVSCSPDILVFTDTDDDDKADEKEVLFTKTGAPQHDHSAHAFVFGPDGKLYWNFGNTGGAVHDAAGELVVDLADNRVIDDGKPYRGGMVFRCDLDGGDFEVLAHNFRNCYEVAVDSFGALWQSDNDDDGNRGVRINFLMEFGNYGYRDEMTGASWRVARVGMRPDIPERHWHLNDPGVVPNLLLTGGGSPTGIVFYEGGLLPKVFHDQIIHCDAGPNVVRAYPLGNDGAGYRASSVNILRGARDKWFRPADVCVAPDGSLIVADWYDPGVGGHKMGDVERGRLFRIAPPKTPYHAPQFDFSTPSGAIDALKSPNLATRYLAWTALNDMQQVAEPALRQVYETEANPRQRARALWLLGNIAGRGLHYVGTAIRDADPNIRMTGLRIARRLKLDLIGYVRQLVNDSSIQVRRECAIALRHQTSPAAAALWAELAVQHDGKDRWYLEALGIAAGRQWDKFMNAWMARVGDDWNTPAGRDIVWRSRATSTPESLVKIISDPSLSTGQLPRYLRAFDFLTGAEKEDAVKQLALAYHVGDTARQHLVAAEAIGRIKAFDINAQPEHQERLNMVLDGTRGSTQFVDLVEKFHVDDRYPELLALAQEKPDEQSGVEAIRVLIDQSQLELIDTGLQHEDEKVVLATLRALGNTNAQHAVKVLRGQLQDGARRVSILREAVTSLGRTRRGSFALIELAKAGKLPSSVTDTAASALHTSSSVDIKELAGELFPLPPARNSKPLPPISELLEREGDVAKGRLVFNTVGTCAKCHIVNGIGKEVGPDLSEIGKKLSREAFFSSILFPSSGISHNYETYLLALEDGLVVNGIVASQTDESISIKGADAVVRTFRTSQIDEIQKQSISLMPADLQKTMSAEELVDVVAYMTTLKKAVTPGG